MAPWNDTEDRQLLLSVISVAQVNPNWEEVSKQMGKTKEAVRYCLSPSPLLRSVTDMSL